MRIAKSVALAAAAGMMLAAAACSSSDNTPTGPVSQSEAKEIAQETFTWAYPMVQNYQTYWDYVFNPASGQYKGPVNQIHNEARVYTPADTAIVTPNSDTPYSHLIVDLRAQPIVVTMPKVEKGRYYSAQIVDMLTQNAGYLGTRADGDDGGTYLIAGPDWKGEKPAGVNRIIQLTTQFGYILFRTQLTDANDLENVKKIQAGYTAKPLNEFLNQPAPPSAPQVQWPPIDNENLKSDFFSYVNFLLPFVTTTKEEASMMDRFKRIGVGVGTTWPPANLPADIVETVKKTALESYTQLSAEANKLETSIGLFGTPEKMKGKYKERALGAMGGIYGNDAEEAVYPIYTTDEKGQPLDTGKHNYTITFAGDQLPPVNSFWSLTMYDMKSRLLVENPIDRYLINSTMEPGLKRNPDGGFTVYVQHEAPADELKPNWLPAPAAPMYLVMRLYLPKDSVLDGKWQKPPAVVAE